MKTPREIEMVELDVIHISDRLRTALPDRVAAIATSMSEIGLMTPISLRLVERIEINGKQEHSVPVLVAGATRLAAAKTLGWDKIACVYIDADEAEAQIWEIDENLARNELTTEEKREHLWRRKQIWEAREIRVAHDAPVEIGYGKPPPKPKGFAAETSAATGLSKSQINRLLAPASLPKLDLPPLSPEEVDDKWLKSFESLWNKGSRRSRERALEWVEENDGTIFDATPAGRAP
jgi:ParB-like nuclease family protein